MANIWIHHDNKEIWNSFVEKNSSEFRQLYEWGEYKKNLGWDILRLVCIKNNVIESTAQILYKKFFIVGFVYIPGGVTGKITNIDDNFKVQIQEILQVSFLYLRMDFSNHEDALEKEHLIYNGFKRPSYMIKSLEYCELDLRKDTKQILAEAKPKWRYNHKKSLQNEIIVSIETISEDFVLINDELALEWKVRNNFKDREVIPMIKELGTKLITCKATDKFGNLLAIRASVISGRRAYHLYNAVSKKGRNSLSGYRILIYMIDFLRDSGVDYFEIGPTNQKRFPGPYRFKYGIGYKDSIFTSLGEWNYSNVFFLERVLNSFIYIYFNSSAFVRKFINNF